MSDQCRDKLFLLPVCDVLILLVLLGIAILGCRLSCCQAKISVSLQMSAWILSKAKSTHNRCGAQRFYLFGALIKKTKAIYRRALDLSGAVSKQERIWTSLRKLRSQKCTGQSNRQLTSSSPSTMVGLRIQTSTDKSNESSSFLRNGGN